MEIEDNGIEIQFDTYIKRTIKNTIINYKKFELRKQHRETSFETLTSEKDISVPFLFNIKEEKIENYFEDEKIYQIVSKLKPIQKQVLKLKILYQYNSSEIAKMVGKSDSRVRNIYIETIRNIRKELRD